MTIEKPSRNEDEYFAQQNAELLRKQREKSEASARDAERKSHYMKCPKDGYDLSSSSSTVSRSRPVPTVAGCGSTRGSWRSSRTRIARPS